MALTPLVVPAALGIYTRAKSMQNAIYGARVGSIAGFVVVLVAITSLCVDRFTQR